MRLTHRSIGSAATTAAVVTLALSAAPLSRAADAQSTAVVRRRPTATSLQHLTLDSAAARLLRERAAAAIGAAGAAAKTPTTAAGVAAAALQPSGQPPVRPTATKAISRASIERVLGGTSAPTGAATSAASSIRVVRPNGVVELPRAGDSVHVAPGDLVFRKTSDTAARVAVRQTTTGGPTAVAPPPTPLAAPAARAGAATYAVPYRWLTVDSAGVTRVLVPYFIVDGGGLTYDVATRRYRGTALVGVEDTLHPGEGTVALPRTLKLQLTATSGGGVVRPPALEIAHTSLDYAPVSIESTDSTQVRIRTAADPRGIVVPVPVRAMTVAIIPQQRSLQGLGLATTDIAVTLPRGMARSDTADVTFSSTGAPVHPASVRVTGAEPASVRLRSGLPGRDSIRAFLDGVLVGETVVTFAPPWAFAGATLAGLVLGGFARFFGARRRKRVRSLGWDLLRGAPFGVIAAAASAVGLDLLQLRIDDPGTWIAVMLTAAIGAWTGSRLLDRGGGAAPSSPRTRAGTAPPPPASPPAAPPPPATAT